MQPNLGKKIFTAVIIFAVICAGAFIFLNSRKAAPPKEPAVETKEAWPKHSIIGKSVNGRAIDAYTYGTGSTKLLFVGGIHGGYEWNSVLLAYTFMDYLEANTASVPGNVSVTVVPDANPDAVYSVVGKEGRFTMEDVSTDSKALASARFNANGVDLNRNFDCKWQPKSTWQSRAVSGGTAAFSEPESRTIRDLVTSLKPAATVFWHSQANAVYASQCKNGILPETSEIMNAYSKASGYPAVKTFDAYGTTGAADDWMSTLGLPAITVELSTHQTIEWQRNLLGIKALMARFGSK
jgi:predicted deacylase